MATSPDLSALLKTYLIPETAAGQGVLVFMAFIFACWLLLFLRAAIRHSLYLQQIEKLTDLKVLIHQPTGNPTEESESKRKPSKKSSSSDALLIDPTEEILQLDETYHNFLKKVGIQPGGPIADHVRHIFRSGRLGHKLNIAELLGYTNGKLFVEQRLLRSILGLFIIIGLLGTLVGLAISMNTLGSFASQLDQAAEVRKGIKSVLFDLRSAFAPSIWGVGLTIFGVVLQSFYVRTRVSRLEQETQRQTYFYWIPILAPSPDQKLLQRNEELLRHTIKAATAIVSQSANLHERLAELEAHLAAATTNTSSYIGAIRNTEQIANKLSEAVSLNLMDFSKDFAKSTVDLAKQQTKLTQMLEQLCNEETLIQAQESKQSSEQSSNVAAPVPEILQMREATHKAQMEILSRWGGIQSVLQEFINQSAGKTLDERQKEREILAQMSQNIQQSLEYMQDSMMKISSESQKNYADLLAAMNRYGSVITGSIDDFIRKLQISNYSVNEKIEITTEALIAKTKELNETFDKRILEQDEVIDKKIEEFGSASAAKMEMNQKMQLEVNQRLTQSLNGQQQLLSKIVEEEGRNRELLLEVMRETKKSRHSDFSRGGLFKLFKFGRK